MHIDDWQVSAMKRQREQDQLQWQTQTEEAVKAAQARAVLKRDEALKVGTCAGCVGLYGCCR